MTTTDVSHDCLHFLFRSELAASATYQQALNMTDQTPHADDFRRIYDEHRGSAEELRQRLEDSVEPAEQASSAWGMRVRLVEEAAKMSGCATVLKALKEGEEQSRADYETALKNDGLNLECKKLIRSTLLPQTEEHIASLNRFLATG